MNPFKQTRSGRTRDWLLYVAIAVLILVLAGCSPCIKPGQAAPLNLPLKWLGFAGMTAIVFGYAIQACRQS